MKERSPLFLFAHGAGAPSSSAWMKGWQRRLETLGEVATFDYPYMKAGRKVPDRLPLLIEAHRTALDEARAGRDGPVVLAGKSMGSRVGCHLALALEGSSLAPAALVCFGYPLRGARGALRDEVLRTLATPVLFLQGSRDPLCPMVDLARVRAEMQAPSELFLVEGGDHSLAVRASDRRPRGETQEDCDRRVLEAIRRFLVARGVLARP